MRSGDREEGHRGDSAQGAKVTPHSSSMIETERGFSPCSSDLDAFLATDS